LKFEPRNQDCLQELARCLGQIAHDCARELQENPQKESAKKALRKAQEDLRKFIEGPLRKDLDPAPATATTSTSVATATPSGSVAAKPASERELLDEILDWSKRLEADPNDSAAYLGRARAYLRRGDLDKALSDCKWGLQKDPDNSKLKETMKAAAALKKSQLA